MIYLDSSYFQPLEKKLFQTFSNQLYKFIKLINKYK